MLSSRVRCHIDVHLALVGCIFHNAGSDGSASSSLLHVIPFCVCVDLIAALTANQCRTILSTMSQCTALLSSCSGFPPDQFPCNWRAHWGWLSRVGLFFTWLSSDHVASTKLSTFSKTLAWGGPISQRVSHESWSRGAPVQDEKYQHCARYAFMQRSQIHPDLQDIRPRKSILLPYSLEQC